MALHERSKNRPEGRLPITGPDSPGPHHDPAGGDADAPREVELTEEEREDLELVARAQEGDREAFRGLVERHQNRVFRQLKFMLRCDRDTAADLSQDVFLRVFRGLHTFDRRAKFTTWLHRVAQNVGISAYRHRRAMKRNKWTFSIDAPVAGTDDLKIEPLDRAAGPSDRAHHKEIAAAVREAIGELPDEFREAVLLRDLQGMSYEEIGEILDVPPGTVRSRIHRGRCILQARLQEFRP